MTSNNLSSNAGNMTLISKLHVNLYSRRTSILNGPHAFCCFNLSEQDQNWLECIKLVNLGYGLS